jgi:uncharacterized protein (TIGR02453 family)
MTDTEFPGFSKQAIQFLSDLKANNNREWFAENKTVYEQEIKRPARFFCDFMCDQLQGLTGTPHSSKIFRIHRDVRFSKDKTPYKAHLHILFAPQTDMPSPPRWFFGLMPDSATLGVGVFSFEKPQLDEYRRRVAGENGAKLAKLLGSLLSDGAHMYDPALKRVPTGFPKDHPRADLLRRKGLAVWHDFESVDAVTGPQTLKNCRAGFKRLKPVYDWMLG